MSPIIYHSSFTKLSIESIGCHLSHLFLSQICYLSKPHWPSIISLSTTSMLCSVGRVLSRSHWSILFPCTRTLTLFDLFHHAKMRLQIICFWKGEQTPHSWILPTGEFSCCPVQKEFLRSEGVHGDISPASLAVSFYLPTYRWLSLPCFSFQNLPLPS